MSDSIKNFLKKAGIWALAVATVYLIVFIPNFYWRFNSGEWGQQKAVCINSLEGDQEKITVEKILLSQSSQSHANVRVTGQLSYAPISGTYYLQDGAFVLPLEIFGCHGLDVFNNGKPLVTVQGSVYELNGKPVLVVSGVNGTVPDYLQVIYNGGILWGIILGWTASIFLLSYLLRMFGRFLVFIGIKKSKASADVRKERSKEFFAGTLLLSSLIGLLMWLLNPVFAVGFYILILLVFAKKGLNSQKQKVAIAGIIVCGLGLVVMTGVSALYRDFFWTPSDSSFYNSDLGKFDLLKVPASLDANAYVGSANKLSFNAPTGWVADKAPDGTPIFKSDKDVDPNAENPRGGAMAISVFQANGIILGDLITSIKKGLEKGSAKSTAVITKEEDHILSSGLQVHVISAIRTIKASGVQVHGIFAIMEKDDIYYLMVAQSPESDWKNFGPTMLTSLSTFSVGNAHP